jgi:hypothetical protein
VEDNSYSPLYSTYRRIMDEIIKAVLSAKRRRRLRSQPIFECSAPTSETELFHLATGLNFKFVLGLSKWLRRAGFGDIDHTLSIRKDYFSVLDAAPLAGCVAFARDPSGNRYVFSQQDGSIYCIHAPEQAVARISDDFAAFLGELVRRDYHLQEWVDSLFAR